MFWQSVWSGRVLREVRYQDTTLHQLEAANSCSSKEKRMQLLLRVACHGVFLKASIKMRLLFFRPGVDLMWVTSEDTATTDSPVQTTKNSMCGFLELCRAVPNSTSVDEMCRDSH